MHFRMIGLETATIASNQSSIGDLKYYSEIQQVSGVLSLIISLVSLVVFASFVGVSNNNLSLIGVLGIFSNGFTCFLCAINVISNLKQRSLLKEEAQSMSNSREPA